MSDYDSFIARKATACIPAGFEPSGLFNTEEIEQLEAA